GADGAWGGDGNDVVDLMFSPTDQINGGAGFDVLNADVTDLTDPVTATAKTFVGLEEVDFYATAFLGISGISLALNAGNVARGKTLIIGGSPTVPSDFSVSLDGSAETNGHFQMFGYFFGDTLIGGHLSDTFDITKGGTDTVMGNAGNDTINAGA